MKSILLVISYNRICSDGITVFFMTENKSSLQRCKDENEFKFVGRIDRRSRFSVVIIQNLQHHQALYFRDKPQEDVYFVFG
jgi:hypothetical protein